MRISKTLRRNKTTAQDRDKIDPEHTEEERALLNQVKAAKKEEPGMSLEVATEATEETTRRITTEEITKIMKARMKVKTMRQWNMAAIEEETKEVDMKAEEVIKNQEAITEKETTGVDTAVETIEVITVVTEVVNAVDTEVAIEVAKTTGAATTKEAALAITRARERSAQVTLLEGKAKTKATMASNNSSQRSLKWLLMASK